MTRGLIVRSVVVATVLGWHAGLAFAQTSRYFTREIDTLRGLPGLQVLVTPIHPDVQRAGLRAAYIRTDVELQLRLAGIRVLSGDEAASFPSAPHVVVTVSAFNSTKDVYSYSLAVEVNQQVRLASGKDAHAVTWSVGYFDAVGVTQVSQIRDRLKELVNRLLNDWLTVNPKK